MQMGKQANACISTPAIEKEMQNGES